MRCAYLRTLPHCTRFSITRLSNSSFDSPILMYTYFSRIKIDQVMRSATFLFRGVTIGRTNKVEVLPNFSNGPSGPISQWGQFNYKPENNWQKYEDLGLIILIYFLQCWTPPLLSRSHLKIKKIKIKYNLIFYDEVFVRMLLKMHYPWWEYHAEPVFPKVNLSLTWRFGLEVLEYVQLPPALRTGGLAKSLTLQIVTALKYV